MKNKLRLKQIRALIKTLKAKNYIVYDEVFRLNIVGVRSDITEPNKFDDRIFVFYKNKDKNWEGFEYPATTDAGTFWLLNPMVSLGTALLKEGQYVNAYKLGLHRGQYKALVQGKPVTVVRQYDRKAVLDFYNGKEYTGLFGINIHRAGSKGTTKYIDKYSAGCQVFANADDFAQFLQLAEASKDRYGNSFTYTLIDERAYNRRVKKTWIFGVVSAIAVVGGYITYNKFLKK